MRSSLFKLISFLGVLLLCGCVHRTLLDSTSPEPEPEPTDERVDIYVSCSDLRHSEHVVSARFVLTGLVAEPGGEKGALLFPATIHESTLTGNAVCYGHTREQGHCEHVLTILLKMDDETEKGMAVNVSDQMQAQRNSLEIYLSITQEIVPELLIDYVVDSEGGIHPLESDDNIDVS